MTQVDYWVPHKEALWLPGKLLPDDGSGSSVYQTAKGDLHFPADKKFQPIHDENALTGVNDICALNDISDASLLHSLRERYSRDEIYTYVSCVLIAINPFKPIGNYSSEYIDLYHSTQDYTHLPPHIYGIAHSAFMRLTEEHLCQAVLISGESGAGKTENTKFLLLYISEILKSEKGLEDKLLEVNPILESFGNARTVRNDNSSRFGKWIEVVVNPATMSLGGASVTDYLLEVTRVCSQGPNERNYHVFYQLMSSKARSMFPMLKLANAGDFAYLKRNAATVAGRDDTNDFLQLRKALTAMKFTSEEEEHIFRIAAGILHIGNIDFVAQRVDEEGVHAEGCVVQDESFLHSASEIMQWDAEMLSKCVRFKRRETGREVFMSPLDIQQACAARDSIAKLIYGRLFKWLVTRCNNALGQELQDTDEGPREKNKELFFGVLDIAGFEFFETNMLEQLFINFVNEKLQQFFNNVVFKSELAEYMAEGVPMSKIDYVDNSDVLELLEGKGGLLVMLDDAVMGVRQTDLQYTTKIIQSHEKHRKFLKPKFVKDEPLQFGIRHYAGDVMYTTESFLEKNISTSPPEVVELMASSKVSLLQELAQDLQGPKQYTSSSKGVVKKPTVGAGFRKSLAQLLDKLQTSEANFVRCIKPNGRKVPGQFEATSIMDQLRLSGVLETVKIRKAGFLMRPKHLEFLRRYHCIVPKQEKTTLLRSAGSKRDTFVTVETDLDKAVRGMLELLPSIIGTAIDPNEIAIGKTKVFIKSDLYRTFEDARRKIFGPVSLVIQSIWRGYRTRVVMNDVRETNQALIKCTAQAGDTQHRDVVPLRQNVSRATVMESSVLTMNMWLDHAMKLTIKLPSLPLYCKAQANLAAQSKVARMMQDSLISLDVPAMQALVARAGSYNMQGPLVDALNERCEKVLKQLRFRRLLQNCVYCDVLADAEGTMNRIRQEEGLDSPDAWLLPDGPSCWTAAQERLEELREENKERARAVADVQEQLGGLQTSLELPAMQAVLAQSMAYDLEMPEVTSLRERCDKLKEQAPHREALRQCAGSNDVEAITPVLKKIDELGLNDPEAWLWPDGPTLYARAVRWQLELQQGQVGAKRVQLAAQQRAAVTPASLSQEVTAEEAAAVKVYSERRLQNLKLAFGVPSMSSVLGDEILCELKDRCDTVQKQLSQLRALQVCSTHGKLEDMEKELEAATSCGLNNPEQWLLPEGQALLSMVTRQCEKLKEEHAAEASHIEKLEEDMQSLMSSLDVPEMKAFVAKASSHKVDTGRLNELRKRCSTLQQHNSLHASLQSCPALSDVSDLNQTLTLVREAGLDHPDGWIAPEGHADYLTAVSRLESLEAWRGRLAKAVSEFDASELQAALTEAASLDVPQTQYADEHQLFLNLQDSEFIEKNVVELLSKSDESPEDLTRLANLLELIDDPDHFDTCQIVEQLAFSGALESLKMREAGFLMRPSCADFVKRYLVVLPKAEREKVAMSDPVLAAKALVKALPEFLTGATVKDTDVVVGKRKVFLRGDFYRVLEGARRRAFRAPAMRVQAAWRGRRARRDVKDIAVLEEEFRKCLSEGGDVHASLATIDKLLDRAARLQPRPAPRLEAYLQARATLAARANLDRAVREQIELLDVAAMQAVLARADSCGDSESAVAVAVRARCDNLQRQLQLRRDLRGCLACGNMEDVQPLIASAKELGLDQDEAWLLADGPAVLRSAMKHFEHLDEEKRKRDLAVAGIHEQLKSLESSLDVQAIKSQLAQAMAYDLKNDLVDSLQKRCDTIQLHLKLRLALLGCKASGKSSEELQQTISEARGAGLESPETWLLPDGAQLYAEAVGQLEQTAGVKARIAMAASKFDAAELQTAFREADELGIQQESYAEEHQLFLSLKENSFVERKVLELCEASSDTPTDHLKIANLLELVEDTDGLDECKLMDHPCLSACMEKVRIKKGGFVMRPSCQAFVRRYLVVHPKTERAGILTESSSADADLAAVARSLVKALPDIPAHAKSSGIAIGRRKVFLTADAYRLLESARQRACRLPATKVQAAWRGRCTRRMVKDVAAVERDLKSCAADTTIEEPERLALLDQHLGRAVQLPMRLPRLPNHLKVRAQVAARADVSKKMKEHGTSNDVVALQALHARTGVHGLGGSEVDGLQGRCELLLKHLRLRRELRHCVGARNANQVQLVLEEAREAGLDKGETWLLQDGMASWSAAEQCYARLEDERTRKNTAAANVKQHIIEQKSSTDTASIDALLAEVAGHEDLAGEQVIEELTARSSTLQAQLPHIETLRCCLRYTQPEAVVAALTQVEEAGFGDSEETWLHPDGPILFARAKRWLQQLEDGIRIDECVAEDSKGRVQEMLFSFDAPAVKALMEEVSEQGASGKDSADNLRNRHDALLRQSSLCQRIMTCPVDAKSVSEALAALKEASLDSSQQGCWILPDGPRLVCRLKAWEDLLSKPSSADQAAEIAQAVEERAKEAREEVDIAKADLESHMRNLEVDLEAPEFQAMLGEDLLKAVKKRCETMKAQLPHRRALQVCSAYVKLEDVRIPHGAACKAALDTPANWLLGDGPRLYDVATAHLQKLEEEARLALEAAEDVKRQMQELHNSTDIPAMRAVISRAADCNVEQAQVDVLRKRCSCLEAQLPLRKALQSCAFCEELQEVQRIIAEIKDRGLDAPEKWLLPDGPKLFARAIARLDNLQEVENVKAQISSASAKLDAKGLHTAFARASELGIQLNQFGEAHQLFLRLQDGAWVEQKSDELRKSGCKEPAYQIMVSNLAQQLEVLCLRVDSAGMREVTEDLLRQKKKRKTTKSLFDDGGALQREVVEKAFSDLTNFSRLRDPLNWGTAAADDEDEEGDPDGFISKGEGMLKFSAEYITQSLTVLNDELEHAALSNFHNLLRHMGDKPCVTISNSEEPILNAARKGDPLRDEVYIQILKQLTENPGTESATAGWTLLQHLCSDGLLPSEELSEFLRGYLQRATQAQEDADEDSDLGNARKRCISFSAETEMRTRNRATTWSDFTRTRQRLAQETLDILLSKLKER